MVKMNNLGIKKTQHEWKMVKQIIQGNPAIHTETLYNLYGDLQSYKFSIEPPTTAAFGGPLALVSTSSQNQTPFKNINNCVRWLQTKISRDFSQFMGFNQDLHLDETTQVFNLDLTLDKIIKDLPSITTQTKVFKTRDFKTILTQVIIIIQTTVFRIKTEASKIKVTTIKIMDDSDEEVIICHNCKGTDHYARECRAKNKTKIQDSAYYAQRADELKKLENQEKQRALMAIHEPSPTSDDEAGNEPKQSNFFFVAGVDIPSGAPNIIEHMF
uniref:CCHC-type domain-containing protein n=1 Tax=Lactuca sativa TaxID=4236 RepID=A0A9R1XK74_LACSA|nr:hypothetical protein LSAT_V11C300152540 [Lactuca sativa]